LATSDYDGYVDRAQEVLNPKPRLPPGYALKWSGEYEFQLRARKRLSYVMRSYSWSSSGSYTCCSIR